MPDVYEFGITGTIGPLIESCLSGLSTVAESPWTVLTGTVDGPAELRRVLDLLDARGTPARDVRIAYRHDESGRRRLGTPRTADDPAGNPGAQLRAVRHRRPKAPGRTGWPPPVPGGPVRSGPRTGPRNR